MLFEDIAEDDKDALRVVAREHFYFFVRWIFAANKGEMWVKGKQHKIICDALMRVFNGECKRLIINVPPRYSKTEIAVKNFIAWTLGHYPDSQFIHTSYSADLAFKNSADTRDIIQSEEYQKIFDVRLATTKVNHFITTEGGTMYAVGAGGSITGFGAGRKRKGFGGAIIIDDILKADEGASDTVRTKANNWFQNTLESRKNSRETPIILIMQRQTPIYCTFIQHPKHIKINRL